MGQWGFYDDEGDPVADMAIEIEHKVLPKRLQSCYQYDKIVTPNFIRNGRGNFRFLHALRSFLHALRRGRSPPRLMDELQSNSSMRGHSS